MCCFFLHVCFDVIYQQHANSQCPCRCWLCVNLIIRIFQHAPARLKKNESNCQAVGLSAHWLTGEWQRCQWSVSCPREADPTTACFPLLTNTMWQSPSHLWWRGLVELSVQWLIKQNWLSGFAGKQELSLAYNPVQPQIKATAQRTPMLYPQE